MGTNVHEVWRLIMEERWGMQLYQLDGVPCTKKEFEAERERWENMDPFKRRAQIFAHEFKLDDSKFFVCALEAVMKSVHQEVLDIANFEKNQYASIVLGLSNIEEALKLWKDENEILKKGFRDIDAVYPIDCTNDRACQSCDSIQPDDGTMFVHDTNCKFLKAVKLL